MQLYSTRQLLGSFPSFESRTFNEPFFGKSIPMKQLVAPEDFMKAREISVGKVHFLTNTHSWSNSKSLDSLP